MINDFIIKLVDIFNMIYNSFIAQPMHNLVALLDGFNSVTANMTPYVQGLYFFVGKGLCVYIVTAFTVILIVRLIMAVVNIVGQYVP